MSNLPAACSDRTALKDANSLLIDPLSHLNGIEPDVLANPHERDPAFRDEAPDEDDFDT